MSQFSYINQIKQRLEDDSRDMLQRIWEPTVVEIPLSDARRDVCILPDGEIRSYGYLYGKVPHSGDGQSAYLSSVDGGISWTRHYAKGKMNSCTYIADADIYLAPKDGKDGLWIKRSSIGPDDPNPQMIKISDDWYIDSFLPQKSAYGKRVWFTTQRLDITDPQNPKTPAVFVYSDDYGLTWTLRELIHTPPFEVTYPHKGLRWCKGSGSEPYAAEVAEGHMMMLIRSPHDFFYVSYSEDSGNSWSTPQPSTFYGTNTTPFLLRLSDGRILAFWNNTKPLSQPDYNKANPPVGDDVKNGLGENAFTNRDAAHVAISSDGGKTFKGYREIILNPLRGNTDFRYNGGLKKSNDKSVHQFQAYELPYGKILVCLGQNNAARLVIFDLAWLMETDVYEDFADNALNKITTHTYVKSFSGCTAAAAGNGHCAWNRAPAAYLVPDPDGSLNEVLSISSHHDDRLYNDLGGAVWNFPMSVCGRVTIGIKIVQDSARLVLSDRWYNTCDPYAAEFSPFSFDIKAEDVGEGFAELVLEYDSQKGIANAYVGDKHIASVKAKTDVPTGISYLVMQCVTESDSKGFYIKKLEKTEL